MRFLLQRVKGAEVKVNGEVCTQRGKKLYPGDTFTFEGITVKIEK